METVIFNLNDGISKTEFIEAAEAVKKFLSDCSGFVSRRLSCAADGTWIDQVEWQTMEDAKRAAAAIGKADSAQPFISHIDGQSVKLTHSELEISLN